MASGDIFSSGVPGELASHRSDERIVRSNDRNPLFDVLRLLAAASVVAFHCFALTDNWTAEPLYNLSNGRLNLAILGVSTFFVISGYLVTQSYVSRGALGHFLIARVLRIYPALIVATLFTVGIASTATTYSWTAFIVQPETLRYIAHTASGFSVLDRLPGAFDSNPFPHAVNGSLWTLPIELRLYVGVAVMGLLGMLRRKVAYTVTCALIVGICALASSAVLVLGIPQEGALYVAEFAVGSAIAVLAPNLRNSYFLLAAATIGVAVGAADPFKATFAVSIACLVLWVAQAGRNGRVRVPGDYSYGLYVYSFPIQQLLVRHYPALSPLALLLLTLGLALPLAAVSWHFVERPLLALKRRAQASEGFAA